MTSYTRPRFCSNLATAIRTSVILVLTWGIVLYNEQCVPKIGEHRRDGILRLMWLLSHHTESLP